MNEYFFPELRIGKKRFLLGNATLQRTVHSTLLLEPGGVPADIVQEDWGIKLYHPTMPRIAAVEKRIPTTPHSTVVMCMHLPEGMHLHPVQCTAPQARCLAVPYTAGIMDFRKGIVHAALLCAINPYSGYQLLLPTGRCATVHDAILETWTFVMEALGNENTSNTA